MDSPDPYVLHAVTADFYSQNPQMEDNRLKTHHIEFEVTFRTILSLIPEGVKAKVSDIGGGAGPYSFALASSGHDVTLVDLSPGLVSLAQTCASSTLAHPSRIMVGDALTLAALLPEEQRTFDIVLLLGPLYHIMSSQLREEAVHQAWHRWAHYRDLATREPERLARKREFYEKHAQDGDYVRRNEDGVPVHAMNHEHPSQMPMILRRLTGVQTVKMVGVEGLLAGNLDRLVNDLQGKEFEAWAQQCMEVGLDELGWMMSDHIIGIAQKLSGNTRS
ncbi:unnamed protein product [Somion occarium]|uniref:Methyltransferase domain-containing protein n=1 Tax=Somion occarium TaxID=3059160 RepID=A0ABP1DNH6_9APHY